jgi:cytochrome P450
MTKEVPASSSAGGAASPPVYNPLEPSNDRYKFFEWSRQHDPVHLTPLFNVRLITRYDDVVALAKEPQRFSSCDFMKPWVPVPNEVTALIAAEGFPLVPTLVDSDPPAHHRIRFLFSASFTPRRIEQMESGVRAICHELVDGFRRDGQVDILKHFAFRLPMTVIMDLLGVPRKDMDQVKSWHNDFVNMYGMDIPLEQHLTWARSLIAYQRYYEALLLVV